MTASGCATYRFHTTTLLCDMFWGKYNGIWMNRLIFKITISSSYCAQGDGGLFSTDC